jgi:hypothetical protein
MKNSIKKTIDLSQVDNTMEILVKNKIPYKLYKMENIQGLGLNDMVPVLETRRRHIIRKLEYENKIMIERFVRFQHRDLDDFILSYSFFKKDLPTNFKTYVTK